MTTTGVTDVEAERGSMKGFIARHGASYQDEDGDRSRPIELKSSGSRLCAICTEPIPLWRWDSEDRFTAETCFSYHRDMLLDGCEKEWEVHDVPYWRPGPDDERETD